MFRRCCRRAERELRLCGILERPATRRRRRATLMANGWDGVSGKDDEAIRPSLHGNEAGGPYLAGGAHGCFPDTSTSDCTMPGTGSRLAGGRLPFIAARLHFLITERCNGASTVTSGPTRKEDSPRPEERKAARPFLRRWLGRVQVTLTGVKRCWCRSPSSWSDTAPTSVCPAEVLTTATGTINPHRSAGDGRAVAHTMSPICLGSAFQARGREGPFERTAGKNTCSGCGEKRAPLFDPAQDRGDAAQPAELAGWPSSLPGTAWTSSPADRAEP
jgi:hypothetical protein